MNLQNSTILITGATSGIGLEFVKQLIEKGAGEIIVTGRDLSKLDQAKKQFPKIHTFQSDVSRIADIEDLYLKVTQQFPKLNVIINNAGIMRDINLQDESLDLENINRETDINLSGTIRMVHRFFPHLKKQSSAAIVYISSGLEFVPFPASPIYSAAKAGVHAYTRALQLKKTNVKVFELAPPLTKTPLLDGFADMDTDGSGPVMKVNELK